MMKVIKDCLYLTQFGLNHKSILRDPIGQIVLNGDAVACSSECIEKIWVSVDKIEYRYNERFTLLHSIL